MSLYICSNCGKKVTRCGYRAELCKTHFCDRKCMAQYNKTHYKERKTQYQYHCIFCKDKTTSLSLTGKYCNDCRQIAQSYNTYKRNHKITLRHYLYLAIKRNYIVKERAIYILKKKYNTTYELLNSGEEYV